MQKTVVCCLLLLRAAPVLAQVQVDAHLQKTEYLAGEPVIVAVDIRNVGGAPVSYSALTRNVRLGVTGVARRVLPNVFGCFAGEGISAGFGASTHSPVLAPGEMASFRYLLKEYDLDPGTYSLSVSGQAADTVAGANFERTLPLNVVAGTQDDLRSAFAPLVSDVNGNDPLRRYEAQAAIIESAPQFLASLIARFAEEDQSSRSAIEALGRIGTPESRLLLKNLFSRRNDGYGRSAIVLALARGGHPDDAEFFGNVLQDPAIDVGTKGYAALGFGRIGGDEAVKHLERAVGTAPSELRPSIATALGNTRSRAAVPPLIAMFGNDASGQNVCGPLHTLTHREWCDGSAGDPAAKRRRWLRWWNENGSNTPIFGPDNCPAAPVVAPYVEPTPPAVERRRPEISLLKPAATAPNTNVAIRGHRLGVENTTRTRVFLKQGTAQHEARMSSAGGSRVGSDTVHYMDVVIPEVVTPGSWQVIVETEAGRSAPATLKIIEAADAVITGISPARAHPAQMVLLSTQRPAQVDSSVELTDGSGVQWRLQAGVSSTEIRILLPDEVAGGQATIRVRRTRNGVDTYSAPFTFFVTADPLPLNPLSVFLMPSVAPGQWTDLVDYFDISFEIERVDRIDVEFRQGDVAVVNQTTGQYPVHIQVPAAIGAGQVLVRTRTWIEQTASEWSAPARFRVLAKPVPPSVRWISAGPARSLVWSSDAPAPRFAPVQRGDALVISGLFPVARVIDLRIQLRGARETYDLSPTEVNGLVQVEIPARVSPGDWRLVIDTADRRTPPQEVTTLRVN